MTDAATTGDDATEVTLGDAPITGLDLAETLGESRPHRSTTLARLACAGSNAALATLAGDEKAGELCAAGLNAGDACCDGLKTGEDRVGGLKAGVDGLSGGEKDSVEVCSA